MNIFSALTAFIAGIIAWTFLEYTLHRFLGHKKHGKNEFTKEHQTHHRLGHYFAPFYKKLLFALLVLSISTLLTGLVLGWVTGFIFSFGIAAMYLFYEWLHKRAHTHAPLNFYGRWLRKHHFYHHFKDPKMNHGVTTPFWDIVFGTRETIDKLSVPRKMVLPWLIDGNGQLLDRFKEDYRIKPARFS